MSSNTTTMNAVRLGVCTLFLTLVFFLVGPVQLHGIHLGPVQVFAIGGGGSCEDFCSDQVDCSDTCFIDLDTGTTCGDYGLCAPLCSDVCGESTSCDYACSSGSDGDCGEYNGGAGNGECYGGYCGDGTCQSPYEDEGSCPADCTEGGGGGGSCGDGICADGETCDSCTRDCYSDPKCGYCGDGQCEASEYGGGGSGNSPKCGPGDYWCSYCEADCGACDPEYCYPQVCGGEDARYQCVACTSDAQCDGVFGSAWCATEEGQCNSYCYTNADCPNSWEWYCDTDDGSCVYDPPKRPSGGKTA